MTMKSLKKEGLKIAKFRGHQMGEWKDYKNNTISICECIHCGAYLSANTKPLPNDIDLSGDALAIGCK